ncbi:NADH-quinone oxidoreductase subunit C [bacterium]|nr:NADH-quinone oxidoreductase subunit C [bacterium]
MSAELETQLQSLVKEGSLTRTQNDLWLDEPTLAAPKMADFMAGLGARFSTVTGIALEGDETELIYHFALAGTAINVKVRTQENTIPTITATFPNADWIEREVHDLYAVTVTGIPNLDRFIRPPELPIGVYREAGGEAGKRQRAAAEHKRVKYSLCEECGAKFIPLTMKVLKKLYWGTPTEELEALNRLCEKCRNRVAGERMKASQLGEAHPEAGENQQEDD